MKKLNKIHAKELAPNLVEDATPSVVHNICELVDAANAYIERVHKYIVRRAPDDSNCHPDWEYSKLDNDEKVLLKAITCFHCGD